MAKQNEVIGSQQNYSQSLYTSWIRKIGSHTYLFEHCVRRDGHYRMTVSVSKGYKKGWVTVHHWSHRTDSPSSARLSLTEEG